MTDYERKDLELKKKIYISLDRIAKALEKGQIDVKVTERSINLNDLELLYDNRPDATAVATMCQAVDC